MNSAQFGPVAASSRFADRPRIPAEERYRRRWGDAFRALRKLLADPEDTQQAFHIIEALSGDSLVKLHARIRKTDAGRSLLAEQPQLLPLLMDRQALRRLPANSLGHAYLRFVESENITPDGLISASETGGPIADLEPQLLEELEYLGTRLRDAHDLWHAVTGYRGDLIGEASLMCFTFVQTRNPGAGLMSLAALLFKAGELDARPYMLQGLWRGITAESLVTAPWEEWLGEPVESVREWLGVGAPPDYPPIWFVDPATRDPLHA